MMVAMVETVGAEMDEDLEILEYNSNTQVHLTVPIPSLVSLHRSTTYFMALTLFDTGAYTSFVIREVAE